VTTPARQLPQALRGAPAGQVVVDALDGYLDAYGPQIYNLDFVEPTQSEDPRVVLLRLSALVRAPARDIGSPRQTLTRERDEATESMARALDPLRRRLFRLIVGWARGFSPYREEALFYVGIGWPTLRWLALRLAQAGALEQAGDLFFLEAPRFRPRRDLARQARQRRELREAQKPVVLSIVSVLSTIMPPLPNPKVSTTGNPCNL
jgi:rifampicin phosphotransferase